MAEILIANPLMKGNVADIPSVIQKAINQQQTGFHFVRFREAKKNMVFLKNEENLSYCHWLINFPIFLTI